MFGLNGFALAVTAAVLVVGGWGFYWPRIARMRVPLRPVGFQAVIGAGLILALVSLLVGPGLGGAVIDVACLVAGGLFLFTTLNSTLPDQPCQARVGQRIIDFTATDSDGNSFSLSSLRGDPFILKFYRGHW